MTDTPEGTHVIGRTPKGVTVSETDIPGLLVLDLVVNGDNRGWFKETWQRAEMVAAGLPDFGPVQNSIAYNKEPGTTRGIHAEPWDKLVTCAFGKFFGAWVDLRPGATFGHTFCCEVGPARAVFVPRGVGNSYQTLVSDTVYSYLVNDHWSPDATYSMLNQADPTVAIPWPIPLDRAVVSEKDKRHPFLGDVTPLAPRKTLIVGCHGQLGRALHTQLGNNPSYEYVDIDTFDIAAPGGLEDTRHWADYQTIVNAAAFTAVDKAETPDGRRAAWQANVTGVANLAAVATAHGLTLVHVSSDYVFDGTATRPYTESDPFCPISVYGQTKAAGDAIVSAVPRHYVVRTSWVIGDGKNFVRTMASLAARGIKPAVVDDQVGRLTFTQDLAAGIVHLVRSGAPYGTYNLTCEGPAQSWAQIAARVFELLRHSPAEVTPVTTAAYYEGQAGPIAPRPASSTLDLSKIERAGFTPSDGDAALRAYVAKEAADAGGDGSGGPAGSASSPTDGKAA
ncbi:MAG: sugar nucleotide-binding protein [Bifidobacteriaceae bacterium]|jgi:dTDP-4-dehydrorhamnose 3,5-epimerase|nr:sugar nucleotide-binding protein [Bifidobacteriaceae bacterium]